MRGSLRGAGTRRPGTRRSNGTSRSAAICCPVIIRSLIRESIPLKHTISIIVIHKIGWASDSGLRLVLEGEKGAVVIIKTKLITIEGFEELYVDAGNYINMPRTA